MSIYETSITNPKKQLEFYKNLFEQLQQENNQLKDNWNKLKEYAKEVISTDNELYGTELLDKMQELESGKNK